MGRICSDRNKNSFLLYEMTPFYMGLRSDDGAGSLSEAGEAGEVGGILLIWIIVGQGPTVLAVGAGVLDIFFALQVFSSLVALYGRRLTKD